MPVFDEYIGIDWTGALPARGIAIARVRPDEGAVHLVPPPGRHWSRREAMDWVAQRLADHHRAGVRALVGIDCGFSLPYVPDVGYLDGRAAGVDDMAGLWDLVDEAAGDGIGADDFCGTPALADPRLGPSFWLAGRRPAHWTDAEGGGKRRRVELVAARTGVGTPVSVFNLAAASKQVGKASLAGMRSLRHLKRRLGDALAVWPAEALTGPDGAARSVVTEIYPTLFRRRAHGLAKIRDHGAMAAALAQLGCHMGSHAGAGVPAAFDDHAGDAMIAAAGMMRWAPLDDVWAPKGLDTGTARREGWIFGVTGDMSGDATAIESSAVARGRARGGARGGG
ncbi:hypothetical protein FBZ89_11337 [Nitrospirillum amazonense]|uniref:DUF429 domain-containing protein n=1 Tax=Nitrospirillum amazonense TaxID=28077 RepID=A0A560F4R0_9PROT|nr:hypothetical protein [Nitrospirillum amazonense]TWB16627.1 hypothetical protein FBZ89_11337 [Nitrospirillum amazonense]